MKKLLLTIVLASVIGVAVAQQESNMSIKHAPGVRNSIITWGFGPRLGVNYARLTGEDSQSIPGVVIGGTVEMMVGARFGASLDVVYSSQGYRNSRMNTKEVLSYVNMPILANFYITPRLAVKAGIQPAMMVGAMRLTDDARRSVTDEYNKFELEIPVGISYKISWGIELDLRYNIGLLKVVDDTKARSSVFCLSGAIKF